MAQWDSITQNTARGADLLAYQLNSRVVHLVPDSAPFLKALVGPVLEANATPFTASFQTSKVVSGGKGRIRWQGALPTPTAVTTETASSTIALDADRRGAAEFSLTHYHTLHSMSFEESVYSVGDNYVDDWLGEEMDSVIKGMWHKVAQDAFSYSDQGTSSIGGLPRALDKNDTYGTYLGIARADSANINLRSNVASGTATAPNLIDLINDCQAQGGKPDMVIMSPTRYKTARAAADSAATYNYDSAGQTGFYGAKDLFVAGVPVLMDAYCPDAHCFVIDSSSWQLQWREEGFNVGKIRRAETVQSIMLTDIDLFIALACRNPRFNGMLHVTSS